MMAGAFIPVVGPFLGLATNSLSFSDSQSQQSCISQYDYLIEYFCSLPCLSKGIDIHPDFIRALILAESNGDSQVISPKNARGFTQIIYSTGKEAATAIVGNPAIEFEQLEYVTKP